MSLSGTKITTFKQTPTMDRQGTDPPTCIMMPDATGRSATFPTSFPDKQQEQFDKLGAFDYEMYNIQKNVENSKFNTQKNHHHL